MSTLMVKLIAKNLIIFPMTVAGLVFCFTLTTSPVILARAKSADFSPVNLITNTIRVPQDQPTIQAGIDAAQDGDLVLVSSGIYTEQLTLSSKTITLASEFYTIGDENFIDQTIIDGQGSTVITVDPSVGPETKIIGFTIQNGDDGILAFAKLHILNNRFIGNVDAIDFEDGGGSCRNNVFENNDDDAIDLDGATEATIEDNIIRDSGDDGIEIRLEPYSGPTLNIVIRRNIISNSDEDGIQLIDSDDLSNRVILIEHNVIKNSAQVGLGLMDNEETKEDFRGASIPERIHLFNNTFINNDHSLTGGDNLIALNNIFVGSSNIALKNVDGNSIAAYNLFWGNGTDHQNSNVDTAHTIVANPHLNSNDRLLPVSPAIDVGTAFFIWSSEIVLDIQPIDYFGTAPDLGAYEVQGESGQLFLPVILKPTISSTPPPDNSVIPEASGFGITTPAGRGGQIIKVTNLNNSGDGSLRAAIETSGARVIVFEVSGTIELESKLAIKEPFLTIAGQTAPSPGITLQGYVSVQTHDVLIQHIRVRPGDVQGGDPEGISLYNPGSRPVYNIVIDHCSISWAIDENTNTWGFEGESVKDVTFSNNIINEALDDSTHPKGPHSKGMLIGDGNRRIAVIGNLFAHNADRNPEIKGGSSVVVVNNLIYNWDAAQEATHLGRESNLPGVPTLASVVGNVYLRGPNTVGPADAIKVSRDAPFGSKLYYTDNLAVGITLFNNEASFEPIVTTPPIWVDGLLAHPSAGVEATVLENAGARPADRDRVDKRVIAEVMSRTGKIIDSQEEVGGWPALPMNQRSLQLPPNPNDNDDGDTYTNLEEWLHQLAAAVEGT